VLIIYQTIAILIGYIIDQIIGDPHGFPHIVIQFGETISFFENHLYGMTNKRVAGLLLVIFTLVTCTGVPAVILAIAWHISPALYLIIESIICWQLLAVKSLRVESSKVYDELEHGTLESSRNAIHMIVGRDPDALDKTGIIKAAIETVAENTSDGVAAPLFYMAIGGALGGCFYKVVNTMDSMIGYKNDKYIDFGRAAAKLDDLLNYIPSRVCAIYMIVAAKINRLDASRAYKVWKRDRQKHASPNAGQTESVMAGALGIQLAGDAKYFGKIIKKPCLGDNLRPVMSSDILSSHKILNTTALLIIITILILRILIIYL
jgi:cobalamin biosynthesis protein cobD